MSWESERNDKTARIEEMLRAYLPEEKGYQRTVLEAMNYSMLAGGKRLRPLMMYETYRMYAGDGKDAVIAPFLAAIEMIHTYSLVHDDLPAMDNDEYRRGRKTTHVVYGEAMAILAGDGLLTYAFETAARAFRAAERVCGTAAGAFRAAEQPSGTAAGASQEAEQLSGTAAEHKESDEGGLDAKARAVLCGRVGRAIGVLAQKAGIDGMLGGQCADVEAEKKGGTVSMEQLLFIHAKKTAAMIESALMIGAILAGAPEEDIGRLEQIGYHVGVAFQIRDDILDVEGNQEELGKPVGSDERNQKSTYVTLVGMERAKEDVERISREAVSLMEQLTVKNDFLTELIRRMVYRTS